MNSLGERLKQFRINKGLTQDDLGRLIGVKNRGYIHYEQNERNLSPSQIAQIAHLGCDVNWLVTGENRPYLASALQEEEDISEKNGEILLLRAQIATLQELVSSQKETISVVREQLTQSNATLTRVSTTLHNITEKLTPQSKGLLKERL